MSLYPRHFFVKTYTRTDIWYSYNLPSRIVSTILYTLSSSRDIDSRDVILYELCVFPPALFESPSIMLKADKPQIAKAILTYLSDKDPDI